MEFINETSDVIRKYRKTEPSVLLSSRVVTLVILAALLGVYFYILTALIKTDNGIITNRLEPAEIIPVPGTINLLDLLPGFVAGCTP